MGNQNTNNGIVYGVSGLPWYRESLTSVLSVKDQMPNLQTELHIDAETYNLLPEDLLPKHFFTFCKKHAKNEHWRTMKFYAISSNTFDRILFLDADTYITDDISDLFTVLDKFDMAAMIAPQRIQSKSISSGFYNAINFINNFLFIDFHI